MRDVLQGFIAGGLSYFSLGGFRGPIGQEHHSTLEWLVRSVEQDSRWPAKAIASLQSKHLLLNLEAEEMNTPTEQYDLDAVQACVRHFTGPSGVLLMPDPRGSTTPGVTLASMEKEARADTVREGFRIDVPRDEATKEGNPRAFLAFKLVQRFAQYVMQHQDALINAEGNDCYNLLAAMLSSHCPVLAIAGTFDNGTPIGPIRQLSDLVVDFDAETVSVFQGPSPLGPMMSTDTTRWEVTSCASLRSPDELREMNDELTKGPVMVTSAPHTYRHVPDHLQKLWHQSLRRWQRLSGAAQRSVERSTCAVNSRRPPGFPLLTNDDGDLFKSEEDMALLPDDYLPPRANRTPRKFQLSSDAGEDSENSDCWEDTPVSPTDPLALDELLADTGDLTTQPVDANLKKQVRDRKRASNGKLSNADLAVEFGLTESQVQRITAGLPPKRRDSPTRR